MAHLASPPFYYEIDGVKVPKDFASTYVREILEYIPRDDDVFIVTYPKCGTTWMQNIVYQIFKGGIPLKNAEEFFIGSPYIDLLGKQGIDTMPRPGAFKTHIPFSHLQYSPKAKYIFVTRNPKDACVSYYHHIRMMPVYMFCDGSFDDFFELFLNGDVSYGDYFDHLLSWFPKRHAQNIFYTTYEDMKSDPISTVMNVARFLGSQYAESLEKDNNVLNNVLKYSGFKYMKEMLSDLYELDTLISISANNPHLHGLKYIAITTEGDDVQSQQKRDKMEFIRKGIVGDWKSHFSSDQTERLDKRFHEVAKDTGISELWKSS